MTTAATFSRIEVLYDGECPFCAAYVKMARLRAMAADVKLIDARTRPDLVAEHAAEGRDIDAGMIVTIDDEVYFGGDAVWAINALLSPSPILRGLGHRTLLLRVYPLLRAGRNLALRLLGHSPIQRKAATAGRPSPDATR